VLNLIVSIPEYLEVFVVIDTNVRSNKHPPHLKVELNTQLRCL